MNAPLLIALAALAVVRPAAPDTARLDLALQPDQARTTLTLLTVRAAHGTAPDPLWTAVVDSEGFRRVMERERGMDEYFGLDRGIDEDAFRRWARSPAALARLEEQRIALAEWEAVDLERAGSRALAYLPDEARLHGTIYPLVREQTNSFVWEAGSDDPAIFMYLEPGQRAGRIEHTLAHELHHIGAAGACGGADRPERPAAEEAREARRWLGAFGEGLAVLAAAGGPDGETHPYDPPALRDAWAARLDSLASDMAELEDFFLGILDGELTGDALGTRGMSFINRPGSPQGPFYTVGWHMASTVERARGRQAVVAAVCAPVRLVLDYQELAAGDPALPAWSDELTRRFEALAAGGG